MLAFLPALLLLLPALISAAPVAEDVHHRDLEARQQGTVQIVRQCAERGTVAITFDDGPYQWTGRTTSALQGNKGTFFVNGNNFNCIYSPENVERIRDLYRNGHTIGSHSWSHKDMTTLSWDQIHDELWRVEEAMERILGVRPLYFRPPFGKYNDLLVRALSVRGYRKMVLWSDDSQDANGASPGTSINIYNGIINSFPNPHLVLNHETVDSTSREVIPNVVPRLRNAGYRVVAFDTCMGSQGEWPYNYRSQPQQRTDAWRC